VAECVADHEEASSTSTVGEMQKSSSEVAIILKALAIEEQWGLYK
jgi:hypothetical protein